MKMTNQRRLSAALFAGSMGVATIAVAQDRQIQFSVPAAPVADGVLAIGRTAGLSVVFRESQPITARGQAVSGTMTAEQALSRFLAGTGYTYRMTSGGSVQILPVEQGSNIVTEDVDGAFPLDAINVNGGGNTGVVATQTTAGTKTDTPLIETPQAIAVVTGTELRERDVQNITQGAQYVAGVQTGTDFDSRFDSFSIRGFDVTYNGIYQDGLRLPGANMSVFKIDANAIQDMSVIRGPSSALFGLGSPGGMVDVTSKRPTDEPFGEFGLQVGNYEMKEGTLDFGGPVGGNEQLLYRLTATVRDGNTPNSIGGSEDNLTDIAPALTWQPDDATSVTLLGGWQSSETPGGFPYKPAGDEVFYDSYPDYNSLKQNQWRLGYAAEHEISEGFVLRQNFRYSEIDTDERYSDVTAVDGPIYYRDLGYVQDRVTSVQIDTQLQKDFTTGTANHRLLFGLDAAKLTLDSVMTYGPGPSYDSSTGESSGPWDDPTDVIDSITQDQKQIGIYAQDQVMMGQWLFTGSLRNDWVTTDSVNRLDDTTQEIDDSQVSGRLGVSYLFDNGVAPYASWSNSFVPNLGTDEAGQAFGPTTAEQYEVGVKYEPAAFNGFFGASLFQINQNGGLTTSETDPNYQVQLGRVRSTGLELEGVADVTDDLNFRVAYTFLDMEVLSGDPATVGKVPSGIPQNAFSIWGRYQVPEQKALAGLAVGLGMRYIGESWGDDENTFKNPALTLFDASVSYDLAAAGIPNWEARLDVKNLTDEQYTSCESGWCYMGEQRTVSIGLFHTW